MEYGKLIKERRREIGVTQEQLSDVSGVSLSYIKLVEAGKANPTVSVLETLLDCLGLEIAVQLKQLKVNAER